MQWEQDSQGRLWSQVLGAGLVMVGEELRLVRRDGTLEPSPAEEALAREQAEATAQAEAQARERAEDEVRRLREELARLRTGTPHPEASEG